MSFSITDFDGVPSIVLEGNLDCPTVSVLRLELSGLLRAHPAVVRLDLSRLRFIDSPGIALLLSFVGRLHKQRGALSPCGLDNQHVVLTKLLSVAPGIGESESSAEPAA